MGIAVTFLVILRFVHFSAQSHAQSGNLQLINILFNVILYDTSNAFITFPCEYIFLIATAVGCPSGYAEKEGDLPGWGTDIGSALDLTRQECAQKCNGEKRCMSFEHSNTQMKCNLNKIPFLAITFLCTFLPCQIEGTTYISTPSR